MRPAQCGTCHPTQLADWRTSYHARAMGPGVAGQLVSVLAGGAGRGTGQLREALAATRRSAFVVYEEERHLDGEGRR